MALLEHALAGVLAGASPTAPAASAAGSGGASSQSAQSAPTGKGATALDAQLALGLSATVKTSASTAPPASESSAASPAVTAGAAAAALTAAQLTGGSHVAAQPAMPNPTMTLSSPVGSSAWTEELGAKVTWMTHQGIQSASLQLSPEHLGPLQVKISVHNGQASVWFGAAQPDTRAALQQSLPQLSQLFAGQGLTLADAGVSREPPRGQDRRSPTRTAAPISGIAAVEAPSGRISVASGLGLVDTYA